MGSNTSQGTLGEMKMERAGNASGLCRRLVLLEEQLKLAEKRRPIVEEARELQRERSRAKSRGVVGQIGLVLGRTKVGFSK
ncbi:MAG: hypothetical protein ACYCUD_01035 [Candidatus Dormibacteria bacterium]